jgi:enoyl-CoA hydratase/carnithine racemase
VCLSESTGLGSSHFLPRLIGPQNAAYLLLTGSLISGAESKQMGIAFDVVAKDAVLSRSLEIAEQIASASPIAVQVKDVLFEVFV